jgi:hypothetical protein
VDQSEAGDDASTPWWCPQCRDEEVIDPKEAFCQWNASIECAITRVTSNSATPIRAGARSELRLSHLVPLCGHTTQFTFFWWQSDLKVILILHPEPELVHDRTVTLADLIEAREWQTLTFQYSNRPSILLICPVKDANTRLSSDMAGWEGENRGGSQNRSGNSNHTTFSLDTDHST